jgi:hypothetical protein
VAGDAVQLGPDDPQIGGSPRDLELLHPLDGRQYVIACTKLQMPHTRSTRYGYLW